MDKTIHTERMCLTEHKTLCLNSIHAQYTFGGNLGDGSFYSVRKARFHYSGDFFAIKIINKSKITHEEHLRLNNEIEIMQELSECDKIVPLFDFFDEPENVYFVYKMMNGKEIPKSLTYYSSFEEPQARQILSSILQAVSFIHSKDIVHRGLNSESILCISQEERYLSVKLTDFTYAKKETKLDSFTTMCGPPGYIAPEILQGTSYGKKVDVWSLGVIAFNLLARRQPFQGEDEKSVQNAIMNCDFSFEDEIWGNISNEAKSFIELLFTLDPNRRPSSTDAICHSWLSKSLNGIDRKLEMITSQESENQQLEAVMLALESENAILCI